MPTVGEAYIVVGEYHFPGRVHGDIAPVADSRIDSAGVQPFLELGDVDGNDIEPEVRRSLLECRHEVGKEGYFAEVGQRQAKPPARQVWIEFARAFNRPLDPRDGNAELLAK
jgi:hypothetical protein